MNAASFRETLPCSIFNFKITNTSLTVDCFSHIMWFSVRYGWFALAWRCPNILGFVNVIVFQFAILRIFVPSQSQSLDHYSNIGINPLPLANDRHLPISFVQNSNLKIICSILKL